MRPALPDIQLALPTGEQIEAATRSPLGTAQMLPSPDPRPAQPLSASPAWEAVRAEAAHAGPHIEYAAAPMGALAGIVASADSPLPAVPTNEATRSRMEPARVATPIVNASHEWHALTAVIAPAPPRKIVDLQPAAARAATPVWDEGRLSTRDVPLAPLPGVALPTVDCLPQLAGALSAPGLPLPAHVGRAVRSCAVLWTLRLGRLCSPEFAAHPIRAKFNDLLRSDIGGLWVRDAGDPIRRKSNLRVLKGRDGLRSGKRIWQFVGAAAAALLLAGVLRPQIAPKGAGGSASWRQIPVRQWITAHATRDFADDFRTGLNQWKSVQAKLPKGWSYNADGFMHPGQLALFRPSLGLTDYRFEFLAQIENKSVDWVVRAHDAENYYALKFTVLQPGPRPLLGMVRYAVIGGAKSSRVLTPLRMMIHANTPYRVTVDVKGDRYRTYIEGQEADFWTEDRLKTGGVGFFSESGERARVYWVKVESHGDLLGRICGLLSGKSSEDAGNKEKEAMDYRRAGTDDAKVASGVEVADLAGNTAQEGRISRVLSKAASLHLDGKIEDAARELARAIDAGERHPALYFALGQLQYELQQYLPASQSYAQAALLQPLHPTAHFNTGVCQGRLERWAEAAESFKQAISNDPARTEAHLALGACLVQLGRHNEALDAYDRFLARHPDNDEALFGKAVALQKRDRITEAVELYRRILNRNPRSEEALSNLVSLSLANQDYEQVRKYAQRLVEVQPKSQVAFEGLAGAAFAAGDHMAAAGYSRQLAELSPQVFENWFNLGVACHKAGDLSNAAGAYAHATQVQPASPQAHLNLGVALQEQGDLKGARKAYERALEIDPKLPGVHWNLGLVHEQSGDFEAAEKLYAQVPENSPDSDDAAFRIGHLRLQRADHRGAIQAFEGCLRKRSAWPEARLNLGIAHWRFGDKEAARTCFEELTSSGCDSKEALRGLAALSLEHQDYDKAFEIYRQLLDGGDRSPELLYNAALICQKRGEPEDAAVLYKEALRADPQFGEALLNLGHALMSMGNEFEARSCWRKAVIAKPELAQRYFEPAQAS
jgi:tetratricopeptide (TPR) repeat protein